MEALESLITSSSPQVITLDGPSAVGKGTLTRGISSYLKHIVPEVQTLDAGLTYRVITYAMQKANVSAQDLDEQHPDDQALLLQKTLPITYQGDQYSLHNQPISQDALRTPEIDKAIAKYAAIKPIKLYAIGLQRNIVDSQNIWWILDGRCMGTAVAPHARIKFYVDADPKIKAGWRHRQYQEKGRSDISAEQVYEDLLKRDEIDRRTSLYPLAIPHGATYLWTHLGVPEENIRQALQIIREKLS